MEAKNYINELRQKYQRYFDIEENLELEGVSIDLFAKSHIRNEKYFASKSVTLYAFENNEYCYVKTFDDVTKESVDAYVTFLKAQMECHVEANEEHMSSTFTGVIIAPELPHPDVLAHIQKFAYQKSYWLGLKGWSDIRLILTDLETGSVYTSRRAKDVKERYKPA